MIVPAYNEAAAIGGCVESLKRIDERLEIIVVDGDSSDETVRIAAAGGATVISAKRGRGSQLHAGAVAARGNVLWFVHADTVPDPLSVVEMTRALRDPDVVGGNFRIRFGGGSNASAFLTWLYPKLRRIGLMYGDSAIFVRTEVYRRTGGFRPIDLFEDLEFVNRLKKYGALKHLSATVTTSSRRFEGRGFWRTFVRWSLFQGLFWIGVDPNRLARVYRPIR